MIKVKVKKINWKGKLVNAAGIGATLLVVLVISLVSVVKAEAAWGGRAAAGQEPEVRLLSMQIFWMDQQGTQVAAGQGAVRPTFRAPGEFGSVGGGVTRTLFENRGGSIAGESAALMVVPWSNNAREYYVVSQAGAGLSGINAPRFETIIGTRWSGVSGTIHTVNLVRAATLSNSARAEVGRLIDLGLRGGTVYWEAAFELSGLHRDEIVSLEALGPGLIKPPRKWIGLLGEALRTPAAAAGAGIDPCLKLGPLSFCLSVPKLAGFLSARPTVKERSRVRLTRSLWQAGNSCGVVVFGKLSSYSVLTFRVKTNGRGTMPAGVRYLPPFDLAGNPGWNGSTGAAPADSLREETPPSPAGTIVRSGGRRTPITATMLKPGKFSNTPRWSARIWGLSPPRVECYTPQASRFPECSPGGTETNRRVMRRIGW